MAAAAGLFERGLDAILLQFPLQLEESLDGAVEVGVDGDPLRALRLRVDGVEIDGDVAVQVHAHHVGVERFRLLGLPVPRQVVRNRTVGQGTGSLHSVGAPVDEELDEPVGRLAAYTEGRIHGSRSFLKFCVCTPVPELGQIGGVPAGWLFG
jgi:hypothetical protein